MKKIFTLLIVCSLIVLGTSSCSNNDGYSLDKYWVSWASIDANNENVLILDNGTTLFITASTTNYRPKNPRVIANYTVLSDNYNGYDHAIRLNGYEADVLTKEVKYVAPDNTEEQNNLGKDPIQIRKIWMGGGYLNINFRYLTGEREQHLINLVSASSLTTEADPILLEFRHNSNGDPAKYYREGVVSFDIAKLQQSGKDFVNLRVSSKEFDGATKSYDIKYEYLK